MKYDCIIVGAGPAGVYCAYEFMVRRPDLKILLIDKGKEITKRKCPVNEHKISKCPIGESGLSGCKPTCSITSGFGGAGAFSDGKFNITNDFGGTLADKIGLSSSIELQKAVDYINKTMYGLEDYPKLFSSSEHSDIKKRMLENNLHLMDADIRHLGTDKNYIILERLLKHLKEKGVEFYFNTKIQKVEKIENRWSIETKNGTKRILIMDMSMYNHTMLPLGTTSKNRQGDYIITYEVVGWNDKAKCNQWAEKSKRYSPCSIDTASLYRYEDSKDNYDRLKNIRHRALL